MKFKLWPHKDKKDNMRLSVNDEIEQIFRKEKAQKDGWLGRESHI